MSVKISQLPTASLITSDDFLPIVDSGSLTTQKATAQQVLEYVTGSTFNTLTVTSLTGSSVTGSTALFTSITASHAGSGAGLTDIPNSGLVNDSITVGSTSISLGGTATTIQGISVLTGSTITGSTALFTTVSASRAEISGNLVIYGSASFSENPDYAYVLYNSTYDKIVVYPGLYVSGNMTGSGHASFQNISGTSTEFTKITASLQLITGDLRVLGTASIGQLNTITQQSLLIGDKYITILSGGVDHTGINGSGFLWGTSSGPGETTGALGEHAHILYDSSRDALEIFPGLYVTGSTQLFDVSGTTAQFTTVNSNTISASNYVGLPFANSTFTPSISADLGPNGSNIRVKGTTYQNTTGRTLSIQIVLNCSSVGTRTAFVNQNFNAVNNGTATVVYSESAEGSRALTVQFYVPAGYYYKITSDSSETIGHWYEYELFGGGGDVILSASNTFTGVNTFTTDTIMSGNLTVTGSIFVSGSSIYGQVAELTSSTTDYTLLRQDSGKFLNVNSGSAVTVTVPAGLPTGFTVSLCQLGAGQITISGAVGVTINNRQSHTKTAGQYSVVSLVGTSADTYVFVGDTSL